MAVAVVTLALAIGVNSAVFSLINGLILRPVIPYKPSEVVSVFTARKESNRDYRQFSFGEFRTIAEAKEAFSDVTAVNFSLAGIARGQEPMRRAFVFLVADNFFRFMGVQPVAGRFFTPEEGRPNANIRCSSPAMASGSAWGAVPISWAHAETQRQATHGHRGRARGLLGNQRVDRAGGVASSRPAQPDHSAFSDGSQLLDLDNPKNYTLNVMARLQPGLTLTSVQPRLPVIADRLTAIQPRDAAGPANSRCWPPRASASAPRRQTTGRWA